MNLILVLLLLTLLVSLAGLLTSHRHKKISSEIIRRLDEHHTESTENIEFLKERAGLITKEADEIRRFLESLKPIKQEADPDMTDFLKTHKFAP